MTAAGCWQVLLRKPVEKGHDDDAGVARVGLL